MIKRILDSVKKKATPLKFTMADRRIMAAHESGHALCYAAWDNLPDDFEIVFKDHFVPDGQDLSGGFVRFKSNGNLIPDSNFVEWLMLNLLAGQQSEIKILGKSSIGASNDHDQWIYYAKLYLNTRCKGIFFSEPEDIYESESNKKQLEILRTEQIEMINHFLDININILNSLFEQLLTENKFDKTFILSFLERVKIPSGFPIGVK